MLTFSISEVKNALSKALDYLPDFSQMNHFQKGKVIDLTFKSVLKDLMNQFKMKPGIDYVDSLGENEPATDFVALSQKADQLITGLMEGKIIAIDGYVAKSKLGKEYEVKAHFRSNPKVA
ncbi:MAG: hypothetical protein ICV54_24510 [Nostoc sp. C3-bin3]|nr:hypothetical protein [Nostoc sp. C3-bin3]